MSSIARDSFIPERLDLFWQFICERQWIWHKRIVEGLPPPWTDDFILQGERFTNVYRELDPGTVYVIEQMLERNAPRPDKLFNVMQYRLIGRAATHAAIGFQALAEFDPNDMERILKDLRSRGRPPFTAAYMVSAYTSMGSADKIENIVRLFAALHAGFDEFFARVDSCTCAAEVHVALSSAYGFGNFLAYQVLVDLLYPLRVYNGSGLLPFSHDDWASAGPGAQKGITMLCRMDVSRRYLQVMRWLRDSQDEEFARLGLNFPYLKDRTGNRVPLSLANIQNCLCEFHKYVKISQGTGRGRRKFLPISIQKRTVDFQQSFDTHQRQSE